MILSDICQYVSEKISVSSLDENTYISTENMLPNKSGITVATNLPATEYTPKYNTDDILISNIRPYFKKIYKAQKQGGCSADVLVLRAKQGIIPSFLYYILSDDAFFEYATATSKGTKMPRGDKIAIMKYKVPNVSPEIQQKIASILSVLDHKIELNQRQNNNLEQQAQALFKSWFVDFEPFGGVMPEDWKVGNLLDIADYLNGLAMQKFRPTENEIGLPVLKIKELRQGFCDNSSELCSPNVKREYVVDDGDVIFSWSGSLLVDFWCGGKCGLNQHLFKVTSEKFEKWFYYSWTKHYLNKFVAVAADKATTMGHIKRDELEKAEVVIPSSIDYQKIGKVLSPIYDLIIQNRIENTRLAAIRDALLPKLMSGEIDVSNVDISALTSTDKLSFRCRSPPKKYLIDFPKYLFLIRQIVEFSFGHL